MAINWNRYKTYDRSKEEAGSREQWKQSFRDRMNGQEARIILESQPDTPHAILGVVAGATALEIKRAYRRKVMEWHPDRNQHRLEEATEQMKKINAAYTILTE